MRLIASKHKGFTYYVPDDTEILKAIRTVAPEYYDTALSNYLRKVNKK